MTGYFAVTLVILATQCVVVPAWIERLSGVRPTADVAAHSEQAVAQTKPDVQVIPLPLPDKIPLPDHPALQRVFLKPVQGLKTIVKTYEDHLVAADRKTYDKLTPPEWRKKAYSLLTETEDTIKQNVKEANIKEEKLPFRDRAKLGVAKQAVKNLGD